MKYPGRNSTSFWNKCLKGFHLAGALIVLVISLNACSTPQVKTGAGLPAPCFDGDWRGTLKTVAGAAKDRQYPFRIVIHGKQAMAYGYDQTNEIADNTFGVVRYKVSTMGDMYVVTWLNQGISYDWTEEQTYSLSYVNPSHLKIVQVRHVSNREKDKAGVPWYYVSIGTLTNALGN